MRLTQSEVTQFAEKGMVEEVIKFGNESSAQMNYELQKSEGTYVEQIIRPTGLLDPIVEVRPSLNQIDDLIEEIQIRVEKDERTLVTTLTKRMAEELTKYLEQVGIKCRYIHSEVNSLDRVEILRELNILGFPGISDSKDQRKNQYGFLNCHSVYLNNVTSPRFVIIFPSSNSNLIEYT